MKLLNSIHFCSFCFSNHIIKSNSSIPHIAIVLLAIHKGDMLFNAHNYPAELCNPGKLLKFYHDQTTKLLNLESRLHKDVMTGSWLYDFQVQN